MMKEKISVNDFFMLEKGVSIIMKKKKMKK